jgi:hypothetical protein
MTMTYTDSDRLAWILAKVDYLEHEQKIYRLNAGGYWPQKEDDTAHIDDLVGLSLVEYIDAMIEASCPRCKGTGDTGSGYLDCPDCDAAERKAGVA